MSLNVEVSSFSNALNPLLWSLFVLWFTPLVLNIQSKGQKLNSPLKRGLNIIFFIKISHKRCKSDKALNFCLAVTFEKPK